MVGSAPAWSAAPAFIGGIGGQEILLILALALVVFGPKRIPSLARSLARITAQVRNANRQFQREIYSNLDADEIMKENERHRRPAAREEEDEDPYPPDPGDESPGPVAREEKKDPGPTDAPGVEEESRREDEPPGGG